MTLGGKEWLNEIHTLSSESKLIMVQCSHNYNESRGNRWRGWVKRNSANFNGNENSHRRCVRGRAWMNRGCPLQSLNGNVKNMWEEKRELADVCFNPPPLGAVSTLCVEHSFPISSSQHAVRDYFRLLCSSDSRVRPARSDGFQSVLKFVEIIWSEYITQTSFPISYRMSDPPHWYMLLSQDVKYSSKVQTLDFFLVTKWLWKNIKNKFYSTTWGNKFEMFRSIWIHNRCGKKLCSVLS